ncbi:MAG TPA: NYN domain-containing protein [Anaerolineae bacterium]|nr:NYN domain-containing protein [Anaerolineae bacterium]
MAVIPRVIAKFESDEPTLKLAVLIDADNAQATIIEGLLAEIATFGEATVKRIYGDFTSPTSAQWKKVLQTHAIKPIQQFAYTTGKNATDSTLIIDAMDLLYTRRFDGFCLVSSDSDFTGLALRIREEGLTVLGFGEQKTPEAFRNACHKFIFTEVLKPVSLQKTSASPSQAPATPTTQPTSSTSGEPVAPPKSSQPALPRKFILEALGSIQYDDAGWVHLGVFGSYLTKIKPDFDPRLYGFKKLSDLVKAMGNDLEIEARKTAGSSAKALYVRRRAAP